MNQTAQHVLVIDDEPDIRELLDLTLSRMGLEVTTAEDLGEARRALQSNQFSFCLTDMRLPDGNGLDLVEEISERYPDLPTAVITAHGKIEDAVYALKMGAFDFVSKPVDLAVLRKLVNTALKLRKDVPAGDTNSDDKARGGFRFCTGQAHGIFTCHPPVQNHDRQAGPQPGARCWSAANPAPARNWRLA